MMLTQETLKSFVLGFNTASKRFSIREPLPTLNEYTLATRSNMYASANMKKKAERGIMTEAKYQLRTWKTDKPVFLVFKWVEKNQRRDKDNVAFAKKFILDALVELEVLQGDSWKYVVGFIDLFEIDKSDPRVEVTILEVEE